MLREFLDSFDCGVLYSLGGAHQLEQAGAGARRAAMPHQAGHTCVPTVPARESGGRIRRGAHMPVCVWGGQYGTVLDRTGC